MAGLGVGRLPEGIAITVDRTIGGSGIPLVVPLLQLRDLGLDRQDRPLAIAEDRSFTVGDHGELQPLGPQDPDSTMMNTSSTSPSSGAGSPSSASSPAVSTGTNTPNTVAELAHQAHRRVRTGGMTLNANHAHHPHQPQRPQQPQRLHRPNLFKVGAAAGGQHTHQQLLQHHEQLAQLLKMGPEQTHHHPLQVSATPTYHYGRTHIDSLGGGDVAGSFRRREPELFAQEERRIRKEIAALDITLERRRREHLRSTRSEPTQQVHGKWKPAVNGGPNGAMGAAGRGRGGTQR